MFFKPGLVVTSSTSVWIIPNTPISSNQPIKGPIFFQNSQVECVTSQVQWATSIQRSTLPNDFHGEKYVPKLRECHPCDHEEVQRYRTKPTLCLKGERPLQENEKSMWVSVPNCIAEFPKSLCSKNRSTSLQYVQYTHMSAGICREQMAAFWGFGISMPVFFGHTNFPRNISRNIAAFPSRRTPWRKRPKWHSMRPKGQEPARCHSPAGLEIPFKWAGITAESRFPESIFAQMGGDDLVGCLLKQNLTNMIGISSEVKDNLLETNISPPKFQGIFEDDVPFPKVGYVSSWRFSGVAGCCFMVFSATSSVMDWGDKKVTSKHCLKTYPCLGGGF